jgi:hypothetical protein
LFGHVASSNLRRWFSWSSSQCDLVFTLCESFYDFYGLVSLVYHVFPFIYCYLIKWYTCAPKVTADHGPAVSGAHNTIVLAPKSRRSVGIGDTSRLVTVTRRVRTARAGKDLVSALCSGGPSQSFQWYPVIHGPKRHPADTETFAAPVLRFSGLLTIGPRFGGALDDAAKMPLSWLETWQHIGTVFLSRFAEARDSGISPKERWEESWVERLQGFWVLILGAQSCYRGSWLLGLCWAMQEAEQTYHGCWCRAHFCDASFMPASLFEQFADFAVSFCDSRNITHTRTDQWWPMMINEIL